MIFMDFAILPYFPHIVPTVSQGTALRDAERRRRGAAPGRGGVFGAADVTKGSMVPISQWMVEIPDQKAPWSR